MKDEDFVIGGMYRVTGCSNNHGFYTGELIQAFEFFGKVHGYTILDCVPLSAIDKERAFLVRSCDVEEV